MDTGFTERGNRMIRVACDEKEQEVETDNTCWDKLKFLVSCQLLSYAALYNM